MNVNVDQIVNFLQRYWEVILFYVPLGIIGVWRWSVWIIRKIISVFYRIPPGDYRADISLVVPVYNEKPDLFRRAVESWADNRVSEIIAVIDHTDKSSIEIFEELRNRFPKSKLIVTRIPGKRPALADGIREAGCEIIALVDSDTVWSQDIKDRLTGPFSDPTVGGVVTRQDIFNDNTLARKIFKINLDDRYLFEYLFLGAASDAVLCISGRTAVYRREAIIDKLDILVNETFWGKKMISGDDKTLTGLIHADGWKSRYLKNVKVYTAGEENLGSFLKQKLRWARNGLRSDSRLVFSSWLWRKHPVLFLHMLDKFISPLTLLVSPAFFILSLYIGYWQGALIILIWWFVSRAIKIYPHLRERPGDVLLLPIYIPMTFVIAVIKIYALMTVDVQGWIIRWDKARMASLNFFRRIFSYALTGTVIASVFYLIAIYHNYTMAVAQTQRQDNANAQFDALMTNNYDRPSDAELEKMKIELIDKNRSDPYGYYLVRPNDTYSNLQRRFNLTGTGQILDADTKAPLPPGALFSGRRIAISVDNLRQPLDKDLLFARYYNQPRVTYEPSSNTIFVREGGSVATLTRISQSLPFSQRNLLEQTAPGQWILRSNLYISKDVALILDGQEVKELRLKSDPGGFIWILGQSGNILVSNTKIISWDESAGTPDYEHETGRSYITMKGSGRMDIIGSELAYLGYVGLPKRGGEFGGSYGVSWKITSGSLNQNLLTGVVEDSRFHDNYFGLYTYGVTGMLVSGNESYANIEYGFDPHDDSNNMLIENNKAYDNGNHGIIISKRCVRNIIQNNESYRNHLHGIMLDRSSDNNIVRNNTVYGNVDALALYESNNNLLLNNYAYGNVRGLRMNVGSSSNFAQGNIFSDNSQGIYIYDTAHNNIAWKNKVEGNETGIVLKNASNNILLDNFNRFDNLKDGRVTADSHGNNIQ